MIETITPSFSTMILQVSKYTGPLPDGIAEGSEEAEIWKDRKNDEASSLFEGNGYADLQDACLAAGIPSEWC